MKNIYLLLIGLILFSACRDESLDPRPDLEENVGAVTLVEVDPDNNFFNALEADFASEVVNFSIDINGFEVTEVESVDLLLEYTELDGAVDPFLGVVDSVYAPVVLGTITSFPSDISISAADVASALGKTVADLEVGDSFVLTFPINTADGRRLTVALASDLCNQPAQPSAGGCSVVWTVACPSDIPEGAWETNVPDGGGGFYEIEVQALGAGAYSIPNMNLDYQPPFYGTFTSLPIGGGFQDVCNTITFGRVAEFGVTWSGTGTYDPNTETITVPEIFDPAFGQGPWNNGGAGFVFTKL